MGINRDLSKYIGSFFAPWRKRERNNYSKYSNNDRTIYKKLIKDINQKGYKISYLNEISFIDKNDLSVVPIIEKYLPLFENKGIQNYLFKCLGFKGNILSVDFLIKEFKKPNDNWDRNDTFNWNFTRRKIVSDALYIICDASKEKEYIELIEEKDTHDDCYFIILTLGKIRSENAIPTLIKVLRDDNLDLQYATIEALGYYKKHPELINYLTPFLNASYKPHKEIAEKSIKKLKSKYKGIKH